MTKTYRPYQPEQEFLLPPSLRDWLAENHLAYFVSDLADQLDLSAIYAARKAIVEPVFGQIKQARGFRRFSLRGLAKVQAEWALVCATHNILKLYRLCYG